MGVDKSSKQLEIFADYDTEARKSFRVRQKLAWRVLFRNNLTHHMTLFTARRMARPAIPTLERLSPSGRTTALIPALGKSGSSETPQKRVSVSWRSGHATLPSQVPRHLAPKSYKEILLGSTFLHIYFPWSAADVIINIAGSATTSCSCTNPVTAAKDPQAAKNPAPVRNHRNTPSRGFPVPPPPYQRLFPTICPHGRTASLLVRAPALCLAPANKRPVHVHSCVS